MTTTTTRPVAPCGTEPAEKRHRRRHEPIDQACRTARNGAEAARMRHEYAHARERHLTEVARQLVLAEGVRVFHGLRCADCKTGLHDSQGAPRWEIQWPMRFVCLGGCRGGDRS